MKLRFWIFLITLLLPTSAFANSCESRMKNKAAKYISSGVKTYMAFGTHNPTKRTIWKECIGGDRTLAQGFKCDGKVFRYWRNLKSMSVKDKSGNSFSLKYKGKWNKNFCTEKKVFEPYNRSNKNTFLYTDNQRVYKKYYLKEAGGKFLLRRDFNTKYRAFKANF